MSITDLRNQAMACPEKNSLLPFPLDACSHRHKPLGLDYVWNKDGAGRQNV